MRRVSAPRGISLIEVLITVGIIGLLLSLLMPAIQYAREASRRTQCTSNLRHLGIALHQYHDVNHFLPAMAIWGPAGEPLGQGVAPPGTIDRVSLGLVASQQPDRMFGNWLISLLPFLEEQRLHDSFDLKRPVADPRNEVPRSTDVPLLKCPSDPASGAENHFQRAGVAATDRGYARGNYALNGGTNNRCLMRLSSEWPPGSCVDGFEANGTNLQTDTTQVWGKGVGGLNKSFSFAEFTNGLSKTVAIEEIRAGVHPLDRRGVWALGFVGSSVTAAHGQKGNGGPNAGTDRIQGCTALSREVPDLALRNMPCHVDRDPATEICEQATARSAHSSGVNLLMADGSAHFVSDSIDAIIWDRMHRRDNRDPLKLPFE